MGKDLADESGGNFFCAQGREKRVSSRSGHGDEQPAGGLRVEEQSADIVGDGGVELGAAFSEVAIVFQSARNEAGADALERAGKNGNGGGDDAE